MTSSAPIQNQAIKIRQAVDLLSSAHRGVALTGAGYSTPSGIPDFRSANNGLWKRYDPMEVASLTAFRTHPEQFYAWLKPLAGNIQGAAPNPAHFALSQLEEAGHITTVVTQNIDGLHQAAGSSNVLEVHGTLIRMVCPRCYASFESYPFIKPFLKDGTIPKCPNCRSILKPDAVLFEEQLPYQVWQAAVEACRQADVLLIAGSSLVVTPVAGLPIEAITNGARLIVINKTPTYIDIRSEVVIHGDVAEIIPAIAQEVLNA